MLSVPKYRKVHPRVEARPFLTVALLRAWWRLMRAEAGEPDVHWRVASSRSFAYVVYQRRSSLAVAPGDGVGSDHRGVVLIRSPVCSLHVRASYAPETDRWQAVGRRGSPTPMVPGGHAHSHSPLPTAQRLPGEHELAGRWRRAASRLRHCGVAGASCAARQPEPGREAPRGNNLMGQARGWGLTRWPLCVRRSDALPRLRCAGRRGAFPCVLRPARVARLAQMTRRRPRSAHMANRRPYKGNRL